MTTRTPYLLSVGIAVLTLLCLFAYLAGSLAGQATTEHIMLRKMEQFSDASASGIHREDYPRFAQAIAQYLAGRENSPQVMVTAGSLEREAFSLDEIQHLRDIRGLIQVAGALRTIAAVLLLCAGILTLLLRKARPEWLAMVRPVSGIRWGIVVFLLLAAALLVWGLVNFEGLFHAFHRVLFRNELWLLNPAQDVLLQLMPLPFFVSYGTDLLKANAFLLLILLLALFGLKERKAELQ